MGDLKLSEYLPWTTNNLAELMAVYKVVELAEPGIHLTIITDSKLVAGWCTGRYKRNVAYIDDAVSLILDIAQSKSLRLSFEVVKGHSQNLGNNIVDRMARRQAVLAAYLLAAGKL